LGENCENSDETVKFLPFLISATKGQMPN